MAPLTEVPGMDILLHLHDTHHSLSHTTSECVDQESPDKNASQEIRLVS
jgi:hypothetical protein